MNKNTEKYLKHTKELISKINNKENVGKLIEKIKEAIKGNTDKIDFKPLLNSLENIMYSKCFIDMSSFLLKEAQLDQKYQKEVKLKYMKAVLSMATDDMEKADYIIKSINHYNITDLYKDNTILHAVLLYCLPMKQYDSTIEIIDSLVQTKKIKSELLLDFIIEAVIILVLVNQGKIHYLPTAYQLFNYYFLETNGNSILKQIIIGILCLQASYNPENEVQSQTCWMTIEKYIDSDYHYFIMDILLDIIKGEYNPHIEELLSCFRYTDFIEIELHQNTKDYTKYNSFIFSSNDKITLKFWNTKTDQLCIGAIYLLEKIYCKIEWWKDKKNIDFPFNMILETYFYNLYVNTDIGKHYLHMLLSIVNQNGKYMIDILENIIIEMDLVLNWMEMKNTTINDATINSLFQTFYGIFYTMVLRKQFNIRELQNKQKFRYFLMKNKKCSKNFLMIICMHFFDYNFETQCSKIVDHYVLQYDQYPLFQSYYIDLIHYYYNNQRRLGDVIEKTIFDYHDKMIEVFIKHNNTKIKYIDLLTDILLRTTNETAFVHCIRKLLDEKVHLYIIQKKCLLKVYNELNKRYDYDKIELFHKEIYAKKRFSKDLPNGLRIILYILKHIYVNKDNEVYFSDAKLLEDKEYRPSQIMLGKKDNKIQQYNMFDNESIVSNLLDILESKKNNQDNWSAKIYKTLSLFVQNPQLIPSMIIPRLIDILSYDFSFAIQLNLLKSIIDICNTFNYISYYLRNESPEEKKQINIDPNKQLELREKILALFENTMIILVNGINDQRNTKEPKPNEKLSLSFNGRNNSCTNKSSDNISCNNETKPIPQEIIISNEIKDNLKSICKVLSVIQLYLSTIIDEDKYLDMNQNNNNNPYSNSIKKIDGFVEKLLEVIKSSLWIIPHHLNYGVEILYFLLGIKRVLFSLGNKMIIEIIIIAIGIGWDQEDKGLYQHLETIFNINEKHHLTKDLMSSLNLKTISHKLKYEYMKYLSDILALYFIEKTQSCPEIYNALKDKLNKPGQSTRKASFLNLIKGHLLSNKNRDNLSISDRFNISPNSQMYYSKNTIIVLSPTSPNTTNIIIRNFIFNTKITISSNIWENEPNDSFNILKKVINKQNNNISDNTQEIKHTTVINKESNEVLMKNSSKIMFHQLINFFSDSVDKYKYIEKPNDKFNDLLKKLDSTPVYTTFKCGIIYADSNALSNEYDLLSYQGETSEEYMNFLNSFGKLYDINHNEIFDLEGSLSNEKITSYVICEQDSFYKTVFHISNLIPISLSNEDDDYVFKTRKTIFTERFINIIWMDNPSKKFDENLINRKKDESFVYLIVYPIHSSHYIIKTFVHIPYVNPLKKNDRHNYADIILNINDKRSVMYFLDHIMQLNMMKGYINYNKLNKDGALSELNTIFYYGLRENLAIRAMTIQAIISCFKS